MTLLPMARMPGRDRPVVKPRAVNYQVNDICNARCVMCHVWQHKRDREMSVGEFKGLLADPFFSEVEHVGITGGEPTLRQDLADYYLALPDVCTRLTGASFITHGFDTDRALATYGRVAEAYRQRHLEFHGMVSLDGLGEVHDRVRGRAGAFDRAARTLFGLKMTGVPTSACCTVVASNAWHLWDLLEWSFGKTYIRFRVGEFINRLSNETANGEIRAFDGAGRVALISFFQHLIESYETDESVRRTYASIVSMLAGEPRQVGCPYQSGLAINVDCRGNFAVCAPKGRPHPLGPDAQAAVSAADEERRTILDTHCGRCIHDYHDDWTAEVATMRAQHAAVTSRLTLPAARPSTVATSAVSAGQPPSPARVLVLGWYGTETIGDLAILASIVDDYRRQFPGVEFVVPSHYPAFTRVNVERLDLGCQVVTYGDSQLEGDLWGCDTVIVGGGPLMDIPQLEWLATIVERARHRGRTTVIEGCGIGPAHLAATVRDILRLARNADVIRLRDRASAAALRAMGFAGLVSVVDDPGAAWARRQGIHHHGAGGPVRVFARELTHEYPQATSPAEATDAIVRLLGRLQAQHPDQPIQLHAMHHFPVGGDDRVYARRLARRLHPSCTVDEVPRTPRETLELMAGASLVIAMRFHAVVFARAVGAPMLAIDYTNGGKIAAFLQEAGAPPPFTLPQLDSLDVNRFAGRDVQPVTVRR